MKGQISCRGTGKRGLGGKESGKKWGRKVQFQERIGENGKRRVTLGTVVTHTTEFNTRGKRGIWGKEGRVKGQILVNENLHNPPAEKGQK